MTKEQIKFFIGNIGNRLGKVSEIFSLVNPQSTKYWENRVKKNPEEIKKLPEKKIDKKMTDEEYNAWYNTLCIEAIKKKPRLFYSLRDSQKTIEVCTESVKLLKEEAFRCFNGIPKEKFTRQIYEILSEGLEYNFEYTDFIEHIPEASFEEGFSQEEYNTWVEDVIINIISQKSNFEFFAIPYEKRTERVWNAILDRISNEDYSYKEMYGLSFVPIQNITIEMCKRALKDIGPSQFSYIPSVDRKIDKISNNIKREEYEKWLSGFSEEEKKSYREWYESAVINCIKNHDFPGPIFTDRFEEDVKHGFTKIPTEAITINMINAYLEIERASAVVNIPIPSPLTNYNKQQYEEVVLSVINKVGERDSSIYGILDRILIKFTTDKIILEAIKRSPRYLHYADYENESFNELLQIAYKKELESIGRTELSEQEIDLMKKFAKNNSTLFRTLTLEILDSNIINIIGETALEKIVRYPFLQDRIVELAEDKDALVTFSFALENLKQDDLFVERLIEKLSESIGIRKASVYNFEKDKFEPRSREFIRIASNRIQDCSQPLTEEEKTIISYLALNPQEANKIQSYDDILNFVANRNDELDETINSKDSTLIAVKNAYLQRIVGMDYASVVDLVMKYGNDPEDLLSKYEGKDLGTYKEKAEKESLEIIIKLKSLIEETDLSKIQEAYLDAVEREDKTKLFERYKHAILLDDTLKRAYGRDITESLNENNKENNIESVEYTEDGQEYFVRRVKGPFNRMVSTLNAYRTSETKTEVDMYDKWNTPEMAKNHALCYSFINESHHGTAQRRKKNIIISINGFDAQAVTTVAPYDLCSKSDESTKTTTGRQQRFFTVQNLSNQTRGRYSEVTIEIQDVSEGVDEYKKIQPASIICFEEIDEQSIKAAIELSKKLGKTIPIELIDRRELANQTNQEIDSLLDAFKNGETLQPELIRKIITKFNNIRNSHEDSNLEEELVGENYVNGNPNAIFNKAHLNEILLECIEIVKKRMEKGEIKEGLATIAQIKQFIKEEREKHVRMQTMYFKQLMAGIDVDIDYCLDELQRMYSERKIANHTRNITLEILTSSPELDSPTFEGIYGKDTRVPQQLSFAELQDSIDISEIQTTVQEVQEQGYYTGNKLYSEEYISRVAIFASVIANLEGADDRTKRLLKESVKYHSSGRMLDMPEEKHQEYSAKIAGQELRGRLSETDLGIIQAAIELQNSIETIPIFNKREREKEKVAQLCEKYGLDISNGEQIECIVRYIEDAINLSNDVFVNGTESIPQEEFSLNYLQIEKQYFMNSLKTDTAKKLVKASYCIQDELSREHLKEMSKVVPIIFNKRESPILRETEIKHRFQEIDFESFMKALSIQEKTNLSIASSGIEEAKKIAESRRARDVMQTSQEVKNAYLEMENPNQSIETAKE